MKNLLSAILISGLILSNAALATGLQVSPVSISALPTKSSSILHVSNASDKPLQAQIRIFSWRQVDNKDVLEETSEVVASPPFVRLEPSGKQLVRLVRTRPGPLLDEENYRIFVDEIPIADQLKKGINLNLRYSIPMRFSGRDSTVEKSQLKIWWTFSDGKLKLSLRNNSATRIQIGSVKARIKSNETFNLSNGLVGYVLPDSVMAWNFNANEIGSDFTAVMVILTAKKM